MNTENEPQKLIIIPEKIIHILLKHLMVLKNENAYLKNNAALNWVENNISEIGSGITDRENSIPEKGNGITEIRNTFTEKGNGITDTRNTVTEKRNGITDTGNRISEKGNGITDSENRISEKGNGITDTGNLISEKGNGTNSIFDEISALEIAENKGDVIYGVFERGLLNALNQFIISGNGQHTLYKYYTYFVEAIAVKNAEAEKVKEEKANLPLEETHILPTQITPDYTALSKIKVGLRELFPEMVRRDLFRKIALELVLLHNNGTATAAQLRQVTKFSVPGFAKHMPKMIRMGVIKKQTGYSYALTEKSKLLLLKTFGVPKNS